ncbi:MAG: bifunctional phosphoribosylaminoimidazolecarboxamide formyltransferase/IMP cyclohydrolase [Bacteroidales bacterium]|nr:bifunctional phosphoribosylaminoimidazolecarboxamide formyltransferase/IMP cyclohydrolase [Bacteroidales bacterium]
MTTLKKITSALISVYDKTGLDVLVKTLSRHGVQILSTGGTHGYISELGYNALLVEDITSYPSILGGRVKTLHPLIFGGILGRRDHEADKAEFKQYAIPAIDLVIVDLYPFEQTLKSSSDEKEIIEKIDIGGISLIRAAAKNFKDVVVIPSIKLYADFIEVYNKNDGYTTIEDRKRFAAHAFNISSHYDTAIFNYFNIEAGLPVFKQSILDATPMRYGENPHQQGNFFGNLTSMFDQLNGKAISYNNLNDIDAAINLVNDFDETVIAILKHNNACGLAAREPLADAWKAALAGDPLSSFGGVIITNTLVDQETAAEINKLFFEVIIAPDYEQSALQLLKQKKNRIILRHKSFHPEGRQFKSLLNGVLEQEKDTTTESELQLNIVTTAQPTHHEIEDLLFANKIVKHTKSNAIVLVKNKQLVGSGIGQTSRVDAVKQAIEKANAFGFDLKGAVMASDAFFPFSDSIEIAHRAGISAVIQPGGSVKDNESIEFCNKSEISMAFTGIRHFKH